MGSMRRAGAVLALIGSSLLIATTPAMAADTIQVFDSSFNGEGSTPGGAFTGQIDKMAINQATGNVYVLDKNKQTLNQFDAAGNPIPFTDPSQSGNTAISISGLGGDADIGIDNSGGPDQGNIYLMGEGGVVRAFTSAGLQLGGNWPVSGVPGQGGFFHDNCGLAVDSSGNVWVAEYGGEGQGISQFNPAGEYTGIHANVGAGNCHFTFDQNDNLFVAQFNGAVTEYDASAGYTTLGQIDPGPTYALALDPVSGRILVDDGTQVNEYSELGGYASFGLPDPAHSFTGLEDSHGIAVNGSGDAYASDRSSQVVDVFEAIPAPIPQIGSESAANVHSNEALLKGTIEPGTAGATFHFEYGETSAYGNTVPVPDAHTLPGGVSQQLFGLSPNTVYHYRLVAQNSSGIDYGADRVFKTYPPTPGGPDPCSNALARKQTGSRALLDCRAYELVSAARSGGYDVESDLVPGQTPYPGFPAATNPPRVLYAVHGGGIPGSGDPTNHGPDPYVATRGTEGWSTRYVGIPASGTPSIAPFASTVAGAASSLGAFAFGGEDICSPCFEDGSTGIPVRLPNGSLVQGMRGSLNPGPGAAQTGYVGRQLSADGNHLVFGSTSKFEPDGNSNGDVSIYDRNLAAGVTHVVSKTPAGATMTGSGIGELDISDDGTRIVIGQLVSTDSAGNGYWHLYMNVNDAAQTIDLTPGTTSGVLYDGMTADGSEVFFATPDTLGVSGDTDSSADIFRADVGATAALTRVSTGTGGTGNTDSCSPASGWNSVSGGANCDAVAVANGVAGDDGSVYFLSPERLDGPSNGTQDQPNLYRAAPGGSPHFIETLEIGNPAVVDSVAEAGVRNTADFQVTANGEDAVFRSTLPLTGLDSNGASEVFRYDSSSDSLDCVSCNPNVEPSGDATLASNGQSVTGDGRVFITTPDQLVLADSNGRRDVYEWENGSPQLISSGTSPFDSGLLSVSNDGMDAYFFTHDSLAPQDLNGPLTKIYDARSEGGFFVVPPPPPCVASDECHGPGTSAPAPPSVGTLAGTPANVISCKKKGFVKKHGRCVKKKKHKKHKKHGGHKKHGKRHAERRDG
jgi:hypothetical protein